jgi:phosphomannomutase
MRQEDAVYGGEMSAHHYFKAHWYCDSGMLPFLMMARLISQAGRPLSAMVAAMKSQYPCSGEINSTVANPEAALARIREAYSDGVVDTTDGLSIEYPKWRFNVRSSNTEPVIRLNVETRADNQLLKDKTAEVLDLLLA